MLTGFLKSLLVILWLLLNLTNSPFSLKHDQFSGDYLLNNFGF